MTATLHHLGALKPRKNGTPVVVGGAWGGWLAAAVGVGLVGWLTREAAPWLAGVAIALAMFAALKIATLAGVARVASPVSGWRIAGYFGAWPGMNARAFLGPRTAERPPGREWVMAIGVMALGGVLVLSASHALSVGNALWFGPRVGMLGIILAAHFGAFHVLSCAWRTVGVVAPPIMRAPLAATSLAEFWGARWNLAFVEIARRFIVAPLARRIGARATGWIVFLFSGVVHEVAISLPARGGWGGPFAYFVIEAAGIAVERSAVGRRFGLGRGGRGWMWTLLVTALPAPLLFHEPFLIRVVEPMLRAGANFLP